MNKNLICFDLDGVLINSMGIANQIFFETVENELGLTFDYMRNRQICAMAAGDRFEYLWSEEIKEKGITPEQITKVIDIYRKKKMDTELPALPYAKDIVRLASENFEHIGAVSSNANYMIDEILNRLGIRKYFHHITGLDDVVISKPHPEIYEKAVEHFNVDPSNALTFEDSTAGITSAKGAGMKVIAVTTGLETKEELQNTEADIVVSGFAEVDLKLIKSILSSK